MKRSEIFIAADGVPGKEKVRFETIQYPSYFCLQLYMAEFKLEEKKVAPRNETPCT